MSSRRLIVNADDFGLSEGVNRGIIETHERGIVTSTSLMVSRQCARSAAAYARHHDELSVGLHLDLGEWVYHDGEWIAIAEPARPLEAEAIHQLGAFRELLGRDPSHVDSHQHAHRSGPAAAAAIDTARMLGVPLRAVDKHVGYCGAFYGQSGTGEPHPEWVTVEALIDVLAGLRPGVTELGCHPGLGPAFEPVYGKERADELRALCDPRVRAALRDFDIELISFADL